MSVKVMARIWTHSKQKGNDLLIELALGDIADDEGFAWPSIGTLAKKARLSPRTAQRRLQHIEAAREIIIKKGAGMIGTGGGPQRTHLYRVIVGLEGGDILSSPHRLQGGDKKHKGGVTAGKGGDIAVSREPSVEPSMKPSLNGDLVITAEQRRANIHRVAVMTREVAQLKSMSRH